MQSQIEDEQRQREEARESYNMAERRCNMLQGEADELRTALEQAERARKNAENELYEASDRVNELSSEVSSLQGQKRKLEADIQAMQVITNFECIFFFHSKNTFLTSFLLLRLTYNMVIFIYLNCCLLKLQSERRYLILSAWHVSAIIFFMYAQSQKIEKTK